MTPDRDARVREVLRDFIEYGYQREKAVALLAELDAIADKPEGSAQAVALPPKLHPLPTTTEKLSAVHHALDDAMKAIAVLSTILRKLDLRSFAVADEIAGNVKAAMNIVTHLISTAAPQPPQVPQADEAVPAWAWRKAFETGAWDDCNVDNLERRARELAKEGLTK